MKKSVVVGLSGGVDSAVAAMLLKDQGYDVTCVFMRNWEGEEEACTAEEDSSDARLVADHLGLPFYSFNFARDYRDRVFRLFLQQYGQGLTPNPDILCNSEIKFKAFLEKALELDADYLATGHYARVERGDGPAKLLKGIDGGKDQSYFLHAISQNALDKALFPLGHLTKQQVRDKARMAGLPNWDRKDSVGICFIGPKQFVPFLQRHLGQKPGTIEDLNGSAVGCHQGLMFHTIGQRRGLGIGGPGAPWYVVGKDLPRNVLIVAQGAESPALFAPGLIALSPTTLSGQPLNLPMACTAKIRYRQEDQKAWVHQHNGQRIKVVFDQPQRAISPGQSIVFYSGDHCLGGAIIHHPCDLEGRDQTIGNMTPTLVSTCNNL